MTNMKVLFLVAQNGFRDEEYFRPREIFENNELRVVTTSIRQGKAYGKLGGIIDVDISAKDANIEEFDALVIAGGPGAQDLKNYDFVIELIKKAFEMDKIVGAICIAPILLAASDVIRGKRVTVWNGDRKQSDIIEAAGAVFCDDQVIVDGKLVTGNGPQAADEFANEIVKLLN